MDDVTTQLGELKIIPVVRLERVEDTDLLGRALLAGGLPCAEITLRTAAALGAIEHLVATHPGMLVGAGTVLDVAQAQRAVQAGARFIVSPGLDPEVVTWCQERGVPVFPGIATPSDLMQARRLGLSIVKFFPAEAIGGVRTLAALSAPFSGIRFIPTGGIHATNAAAYLRNDAVFAVGGSWMVPGDAIRAGDAQRLTELAQEATRLRH